MYDTTVSPLYDRISHAGLDMTGNHKRLILKNGRIIDPKHNTDRTSSLIVKNGLIDGIQDDPVITDNDKVIDCTGLIITPGLIDMHIHLGDLFEVSTDPVHGACRDGVTTGLSPGAGNTFLAPSLIGAEIDRGLPMNVGVYLGAASVLGTMLSRNELIDFFKGELSFDTANSKMSRNAIACHTGMLAVGIKDHMGHFIMPDESIDTIFEITSGAGLVYMSHTQDPAHAERLAKLSKGRALHLAHATAAGCGTHTDPLSGMKRVISLVDGENITAEFVTSMLRQNGGCREGLVMSESARQEALQAIADKKVRILISDGQNDATMKGFGDSRDNIPAIIELWQNGVLSLIDSVATMTYEPAMLLARRTGNNFFGEKLGNLGAGALANITVIDATNKRAVYTITNGQVSSFESRIVRRSEGAGGLISRFGITMNTGVGDLAMYAK